MLKGKKKLLAAQVLLGLLVASQAYAANYTINSAKNEDISKLANNEYTCGNWAYRSDNEGRPILGGDNGVWEQKKDKITGNTIIMDTNIAEAFGNNGAIIKAKTVTDNTIKIGEYWWRSIADYYSQDHILRNVFNDLDAEKSEGNTLVLGAIVPDASNPALGIEVGAGNDIELLGGTIDDKGTKYTANYSDMSFAGRNLTLADKGGTDKIKSADMKGNIEAKRDLNVTEGISAGGNITVAGGGLTAGKGISAGGSIFADGSIESTGDITAEALTGKGISATGAINIKGAIDALNGSSMTRAAGAGSLSGKDITAGSINASSVTATGNINTGSMNVTGDVTGVNITINNGKSYVGGKLSASGNLNIDGDSTLEVETIQVAGGKDKLKINSTATGTILSATTILGASGTQISMNDLVDTSDTTIDEGLFTKVYGTKVTNNFVESVLKSNGLSEKSKSVVETQIASLAGVITSADLLSNAGFSNASQAVQQSNAEGGSAREMVPYAAAGYGNMRQESGSYVDVQGSAFNIGFAKEVKNGSGKLLFGPMIEYGRGSYESYLDDGTKGNGNTQNFGLGVMARQNNDNGTYYEGSLRYGKLTSNYNSGDLGTAGADYDTDANYWGAHFGLGKVFQLNDKNSIDTYCKFFYTNQGSSSANILGSNVEFDAVKSKRSRLGFRFNHATSDVRSIYAGLAWQHEFDGSACATANGYSMPSPSIKGNSMMVELGVNVAPKSSPVSFDLGVSGWAGKQKGYSLNANMLWSF